MKIVSDKLLKSPNSPDLENANVGDDEENLEAPHSPIIFVDIEINNARICQCENLLKGHTRSWPRSSFALFDSN